MSDITLDPSVMPAFEIRLITPQEAEGMLDQSNTRNRSIRRDYVADLARDMKNGQWVLNGEAIKIDVNGRILDGQHRLLAVVLSNTSVLLAVISNLDPESQFSMDLGIKRGTGDHLKLRGHVDAFALAAITRTAWQWEQDRGSLNSHIKPTQKEIDAFILGHPEILRSLEIATRCYRGFRFLTKTAYGVAHYALMQETDNDGRIPEFFARVEDGANLDSGNPIHTLRRRAMSDRDARIRLLMGDQVGYLLYTYNAWIEFLTSGRTLYKFSYQRGQKIKISRRGQDQLPAED